jgi:hypothetical protein
MHRTPPCCKTAIHVTRVVYRLNLTYWQDDVITIRRRQPDVKLSRLHGADSLHLSPGARSKFMRYNITGYNRVQCERSKLIFAKGGRAD